jgi:hypothetical protein
MDEWAYLISVTNIYYDKVKDFPMLSNIYFHVLYLKSLQLWTLIVENDYSMCNGCIWLLHINMSYWGFSCEYCSRKCVCGMSLMLTFIFVDVSMLFKQELHFFYEGVVDENIFEWIWILRWNCW